MGKLLGAIARDLVCAIGAGLVLTGLGEIYLPLALIAGGAALIAGSLILASRG